MSTNLATREYDSASGSEIQVQAIDLSNQSGALGAITRAEIDSQIATARRFPRSIRKFRDDAEAMVTGDKEIAASCYYVIPRAGKQISGPSIRLAEIVAYAWTNIRTSARIIDDDGRTITAQAICLDLERNNGMSVTAARRVTHSNGSRYTDDMVTVTSQAAIAIVIRNAIFKVVPSALVMPLERAARATVAGTIETFDANRTKWLDYFAKKKVDADRVCRGLGIKGPEDMTLEHLSLLAGLATAIKDRELTVEEAFPVWKAADEVAVRRRGVAGLRDRAASKENPEEPVLIDDDAE